MKNDKAKTENKTDFIDLMIKFFEAIIFGTFHFIIASSREARIGFMNGAMPVVKLLKVNCIVSAVFALKLDFYIIRFLKIWFPEIGLAPPSGLFRVFLWIACAALPFLLWGWRRHKILQNVTAYLDDTFNSAGLVSNGKIPRLIRDYVTDTNSRVLQFFSDGVTTTQMSEKKELLENKLSIQIEKIWQDKQYPKIINIEFAQGLVPDIFPLKDIYGYGDFTFPIGKTRSEIVIGDLKKVPHYLFAGQTGFGKSTFIRTMTTVLIANNKDLEVLFIDLKGSEAPVFGQLPNIKVATNIKDAVDQLQALRKILLQRKELFTDKRAEDLEAYNKKENWKQPLNRILLIVDEYAHLMPNGIGDDFKSKKDAISIINWIACTGRSFGVNLVIGVQKPDTQNLDSTAKANLGGVLCFQVQNATQSRVVLDNHKATNLGGIKGRAVWQANDRNEIVQTPFVPKDDLELFIEEYNRERVAREKQLLSQSEEGRTKTTEPRGTGFPDHTEKQVDSEGDSDNSETTDWEKTNN